MVFNFNVFHVLGDVSHTVSKVILIWGVHSNSSAEGVSLITQALYALVFCTRYLDIFTSPVGSDVWPLWNFCLKIFYTLSSFYIIFLMTSVYARTREREKAWKYGLYCLGGAIVISPFWWLIFSMYKAIPGKTTKGKFLWVFSEILESVCVIPQLVLLRQTTVPTVIDSFYLVTLGAYRLLYVLNWIDRAVNEGRAYKDPTSWVWGTIQTALIIDFGWVYWTRQRVKLRKGGVVDSEDLGRGWLVGRLVGRKSLDFDFDAEEAARLADDAPARPRGNGWGKKGISVSADEGILDRGSGLSRHSPGNSTRNPEEQRLADPDAFEDDSDEGMDAPPAEAHRSGIRGGDEWNDDIDDDAQVHDGVAR
ncbi:ER lumen protein retaining receptor [Delitschia confertaspora ATCC 74209]|uniref:ER lumen protein retaining receptor n=1 Tax=Delitschia confertaspora ATCC 74209 TaxID=1513339 RepID=A0A9P4MVC1_9PLEO|nr:ER lumen protein retaining receptor [Delitschia confertaspora ATCC 74209]